MPENEDGSDEERDINVLTTRLLSLFVESSTHPVIVVDGSTRVLLINKDALRIIGIKGSFPKKGLEEYIPDSSAVTIRNMFVDMRGTEEVWKECTIEVDVTGLKHNLTIIPIMIPDPASKGSGAFILMFKTGSTETIDMHKIKMAAIGEFAAGIAHELNTPLANISLIAENLTEETKDEGVICELNKIVTQVEFSARIVRELLAFSRKERPTFEMVDLNSIVEESLDVVKVEETYRLQKDLQEDLPMVKADPYQIQEVLMNLIQNAKDAMAEGGDLFIRTRFVEGAVEVQVRDTGNGIPEENLKQIFQPFFSTKPHGKGVGLGLAICSRIIANHKGELKAESEVGRGTVFTVKIPRVK